MDGDSKLHRQPWGSDFSRDRRMDRAGIPVVFPRVRARRRHPCPGGRLLSHSRAQDRADRVAANSRPALASSPGIPPVTGTSVPSCCAAVRPLCQAGGLTPEMVAAPGLTAVTIPSCVTVATPSLLDDQLTALLSGL